jgi:DNA recombination protein RmuC
MDTVFSIFIGVFFGALVAGAVVWILVKRFINANAEKPKEDDQGLLLLQNQLEHLTRSIDTKLSESTRDLNEGMRTQLQNSQRIVGDVTEKLTRLEETNKQVVSFSENLRKLQDTLTNPKQRGVLGEYYLETVLQNVLPPGSYATQHPFKNGEIVDAVVFVKDKIVPIDSKFSLENYNRMVETSDAAERARLEKVFVNDLKMRIQETSKYIRPSEGTTDFAFMFIPSEGIYYDLITNKVGVGEEDSLIQRAASRHKVIIVSPTSFLAYLQTVLQGLKALQIEESAKEIRKRVEDLSRHINRYEDYYKKLGNALSTTVNHYNAGYKELGKIDKDVLRISGNSADIEPQVLERPKGEE